MNSADFPGTERLQIRRKLGEGAFGVVYEAFDKKRGAAVALKTLKMLDATALYRFKQEFRSIADVTHRNLVMLYELTSENDQWFFTMELVDGVTFRRHLRPDLEEAFGSSVSTPSSAPTVATPARSLMLSTTIDLPDLTSPDLPSGVVVPQGLAAGPPDLELFRATFRQLADAVMTLHHADILHRDLKPSNVLVTRDGRVVVLDFGLAAGLGLKNVLDSVGIVGTPPFMAPEQMTGSDISEASDWFSIGVMMYDALTGRLPFTGTLREMFQAKQRRDIPQPKQIASGIPEDLNELCWGLLSPDPAARASGREVLGVLGRSSRAFAPGVQRRTPLIGRESQIEQLRNAYKTSRKSKLVVVGVHGRSGMGKTALVRSFCRDLVEQDSELMLLTGRCYERETVPYKALDSIIDALTQHLKNWPVDDLARILPDDLQVLGRVFPVLLDLQPASMRHDTPDIPDAQEMRRRAFSAFRELFVRLTKQKKVVAFIDDLHWGDLDSGGLLMEMLQPVDQPPMLLIVCYRTDEKESSPLLRELLPIWTAPNSHVDFREIETGELTTDDARDLARSLFAKLQPDAMDRAEAIARECGGNPFFLDELVRHAASSGEAVTTASLDDLIRSRVAQLPEDSRRLLEFIAVAGQPLEMLVAQRAAGLEAEEHPAYEFLRAAHLVRTHDTGRYKHIETYHDRVRESVVAAVDGDRLKADHLRLAQVWEATGRFDAETLAEHFEHGGESHVAADYAVQAADLATGALAFDRGARLYRKALELRPYEKAPEHTLRVKLADALANAGRGAEAAREYLTATENADQTRRVELRRRAAEGFLFTGHIEEGLSTLQEVLRLVDLKLAPSTRRAFFNVIVNRIRLAFSGGFHYRERAASEIPQAELLRIDTCWSAAYALGMTDIFRGADFQMRHILLALRSGEPYRISRAMALEIGFAGGRGARAERRAEAFKKRAMELAERVNNPHAVALVILQIGAHEQLSGRFNSCSDYFEQAEQILRERCTGVAWELDVAQLFWLHTQLGLGNWKKMTARMNIILKEAHERGDLYIATYIRSRVLFMTRLVEDRPDLAWEEQQRALEPWLQQGFHVQHYWDWIVRCEIDLYAGRPQDAYERLSKRWPEFVRSLIPQISAFRSEASFLRARAAIATAAINPKSERRLLKEAGKIAGRLERETLPLDRGRGHAIKAAIASTAGNRQSALEHLADAQEFFDSAGFAGLAAASRCRRGAMLGGSEGGALVSEAMRWMDSQGVRNPWALTEMFVPGRWIQAGKKN